MSTKEGEIARTAESLVEISDQGVYFVIAFIHDIQYHTAQELKLLMEQLEKTPGAISKKCTCALCLGKCNCK